MLLKRRTPRFIKRLYYSLTWDHCKSTEKVYLTFDDGPTPIVTEKVLDILAKYKVKATFFCLGRNVERSPEIYRKILTEGHSVGNHTYSHLKGWQSKLKHYLEDIDLARHYIKSNLFRPPYGQIKRSQIASLKKDYKIIMWDVMSMDFNPRISEEESLKMVMKNTRPGSIIVFHDSVKAFDKVNYVLPKMILGLQKQGLKFDKL